MTDTLPPYREATSARGLTSPAIGGFSVSKSDAVDLEEVARALYVGGAGNLKVTTLDGSVLTFVGLQTGALLPVSCTRVWSTGTTAANIVGLV